MTLNTNGAEENIFSLYVVDLAVTKPIVGYRQHVGKLINAAVSQEYARSPLLFSQVLEKKSVYP